MVLRFQLKDIFVKIELNVLFEGADTLTEYSNQSFDLNWLIFVLSRVSGLRVVPDDLKEFTNYLLVQIQVVF